MIKVVTDFILLSFTFHTFIFHIGRFATGSSWWATSSFSLPAWYVQLLFLFCKKKIGPKRSCHHHCHHCNHHHHLHLLMTTLSLGISHSSRVRTDMGVSKPNARIRSSVALIFISYLQSGFCNFVFV